MPTLHEVLWEVTSKDLAYRAKLLGVKPRSLKKVDLVDAVKGAPTGVRPRAP